MRKLGALVLAVPVLIVLYLATLVRRGGATRIGAGVAAAVVVGLVIVASLPPAPSNAVPTSGKPAPVAAELLDSVRTGHALDAPFTIAFSAPMDAAAVAAALRIQPEAGVTLTWDDPGTTLTIAPVDHWQPDTLYSVTVGSLARAVSGGPITTPVRALVLTAPAGSGELSATGGTGDLVRLDSAFLLRLDRDVPFEAVRDAIRTEPALDGALTKGTTPGLFVFTPSAPLAADTTYRIWLDGLTDGSGIAFGSLPALEVSTVATPDVVRFRPRKGTTDVEQGATISVRFTQGMDRARTAAAFHVTVGGKELAGKITWAEKDTVLVFQPKAVLPFSATVTMTVDAGAASTSGAEIGSTVTAAFTVKAKPKPAAPRTTTSTPITKSGGGGAVSGSWTAVESYYLKLMNCTRTGGWVTSTGSCSSPGGRNVAALKLDSGISSRVSRPYAKMLATKNLCSHFIGGNPGDRLRAAGYTSYRWAENLGCRSGDPYAAVLGSHLFFQSEKSYNGGHYVNLMNAAYDRAGIGVWVSSGRVRLVVDFYHP